MGVHRAARQPGVWQCEQEHKPQGSWQGPRLCGVTASQAILIGREMEKK